VLHYHNPEDILRSMARSFITGEFADCKDIMRQRMIEYFSDDIKHEYRKMWEHMETHYNLSTYEQLVDDYYNERPDWLGLKNLI